MTSTPSIGKNHIFPSADVATIGLLSVVVILLWSPSVLSQPVALTFFLGSVTQRSNSDRATRTKPQAVYNQKKWSLSSSTQWRLSQGNPFALENR